MRAGGGTGLAFVDHSAFHDELHVLDGGDVVEGIAGDGDYVGVEAGFQLAHFFLPGEDLRAVEVVGLEDGGGGHAVLHQQLELAGLSAVGEGSNVGTDGHGDSGGDLAFELVNLVVEHGVLARRCRG